MKRLTTLLVIITIVIVFVCGCSPKTKIATFYPPEPASPRIQHLKTYTSQDDFRSSFIKNIVGQDLGYRLGKAYGVAFATNKLYVVDSGKQAPGLTVFDFSKSKAFQILGPLKKPIDVVIDAQENKYVTDTVLKKIVIFNKNDEYLKTFGIGENRIPGGISASNNKLYVTDIKNGEVIVLDINDGRQLNKFPTNKKLFWPTKAVAVPESGRIYVVQTGSAVVSIFDMNGNHLRDFGKPGNRPGDFARPKSVAVDNHGNVYVVDSAFENVQIFNSSEETLMSFSGPRNGNMGLVLPAGITIDQKNIGYFQQYADPDFTIEYLIAVSSQGTPASKIGAYSSVDIFGFGKKKGVDYGSSQIPD